MAQNIVHGGLSYPYPNIRMHAYGVIASIPRADNRTQSPYHAFGTRGRVFEFDDAAGVATTAAPSVAASPAAPAVSAGLPVFAASRSAAASESSAASNLSEDDPAVGGSAASDAPVVSCCSHGARKSRMAQPRPSVRLARESAREIRNLPQRARKSGVALPRPSVRLARESPREVGNNVHL